MLKKGVSILLAGAAIIAAPLSIYGDGLLPPREGAAGPKRGVWVTSFSEKEVLRTREGALGLINFCRDNAIDDIYLQLYRAGEACCGPAADNVDLLIKEAGGNNIKVHAWINLLSVAQNMDAPIIAKFGRGVLTRDQHLRPSINTAARNESDKFYLRDNQLFLEPGDPRVAEYIFGIIDEIVKRYPALNGIHLDYIRYPTPVPYLPDSRFNEYGLSYGYGEGSVARFKEATGLDPLSLGKDREKHLLWSDWKRGRVSAIVREISARVKNASPGMAVSCAVIPSVERAYSIASQDWPSWLDEGIVDFVVLMDYTSDARLAAHMAASALPHRGKGKVHIGIGAFLMKEDKARFLKQYRAILDLDPDGIVLFSYDDL